MSSSQKAFNNESSNALARENWALGVFSACNRALMSARSEFVLLAEMCRVNVEEAGYMQAWSGLAEEDGKKTVTPVTLSGLQEVNLESVNITTTGTERGRAHTVTTIRTEKSSVIRNILTELSFEHLVSQEHYTGKGGSYTWL